MASWTVEETLKVIEIWSEDAVQVMLEGSRRNKDIFVKIAREMEIAGYEKSGEQCSSKIKKLRFEYRKIKDNRNNTGRGRKEWKFFDSMDAVLRHKPATRPPVVVESGSSYLSCDPDPTVSNPTTLSSSSTLNDIEDDDVVEEEESVVRNEAAGSGSHEREELSRSRSETPADAELTPGGKKSRKRKRGTDKFDRIEGLLEMMVKMQEESDSANQKLDEKMMEMEERRQKESQEFQLRSMFHQGPNIQAPGPSARLYNNYSHMYSFMHPPSQDDNI